MWARVKSMTPSALNATHSVLGCDTAADSGTPNSRASRKFWTSSGEKK